MSRERHTFTGVFLTMSMVVCFSFIFALLVPVVPALYQQYTQQDRTANYGYHVSDAATQNFQQRQETHHNGVIKGFYSLVEADGSLRLVTYTADKSGFRALVAKQKPGSKISAIAHT